MDICGAVTVPPSPPSLLSCKSQALGTLDRRNPKFRYGNIQEQVLLSSPMLRLEASGTVEGGESSPPGGLAERNKTGFWR